MKIGFDAKRAYYNYRGLGSYARTVISGLARHHSGHEYHAYCPLINIREFYDPGTLVHEHKVRSFNPSYWRTFRLAKQVEKDQMHIFHGLSNELPVFRGNTKTKKVVTIHDTIFKRRPRDYSLVDRTIYDYKVKAALRSADHIVAVSEYTKNELVHFYSVEENKIKVINPICDDCFFEDTAPPPPSFSSKFSLPEQFLLFVGPSTSNKNLDTLLKAMEFIPDVPLVIIGRGHAASSKLSSQVIIQPKNLFVEQHELSIIYRRALLTIVPSFHEGFGLPVIESLASKTPVACASTSALPDTLGPGGLTFEPSNPEQIADAVEKLLKDSARYNRHVAEGYQHAQKYRSKLKSKELMDLYLELEN